MTSVNHARPWVQQIVNSFVCCEIGVTTKTVNYLKPSDITLNQEKSFENHPETTQNYLHQRNRQPFYRATSHQILCCWLWTWFNNQESRIRKTWRRSSNDHESQRQIENPFSQFWEIKQVYNICLNETA